MKTHRRLCLTTAICILASSALLNSAAEDSQNIQQSTSDSTVQQSAPTLKQFYDLLKAKHYHQAADLLKEMLRLDPKNRRARIELVYLETRFKNWNNAIVLLDSLLKEDPSDMRLRMERGYALQSIGDLDMARDDFNIIAQTKNKFQNQARKALKVVIYESSKTDDDLSAIIDEKTEPKSKESKTLTTTVSDSTESTRDEKTDALLNEAYDDLRNGKRAQAREEFQQVLIEDPSRTDIYKQLGYMNIADGNLADAAKEFEGAHKLAPLDYQTALELGYTYDSLHDEASAKKAFATALPSPDPKIHNAAAAALKNIYAKTDPFYIDVAATPFYTNRFMDTIAYSEADIGYKPAWSGPLSFYLANRYTQDTRSGQNITQTEPAIYSDNFMQFGPGIRFQPKGYNVSLSAEEDESINLLRSSAHPNQTELDNRIVLADYHYWQGKKNLFADAGGSIGYYSRYLNDVISYIQLRAGTKVWDNHTSQLSLYVPVNIDRDTNHYFYNNLAEIGAGMAFQPSTQVNLQIRAEYLYGLYMGAPSNYSNPYGPRYTDFRVTLIYFGHFTRTHPEGY